MVKVENYSDNPAVFLCKLSMQAWQWWMLPLMAAPDSLMIWLISLDASITCIHPADLSFPCENCSQEQFTQLLFILQR